MNAEPAKRKEIIKDKQFLNWQKLGLNEADIEKIKNQFVSILRDIKSSMQNKELTSTVATAESIKTIRNALLISQLLILQVMMWQMPLLLYGADNRSER